MKHVRVPILCVVALLMVVPLVSAQTTFNLFNSNAEERINWTSGSAFLRPLQVIPPRVARVALKLTY